MGLTDIPLSDWEILVVALALVGSLGAFVAIRTRPRIDVNRDGTVNPSEVPIRVQNNFKAVVLDRPTLYDLAIGGNFYRTALESFLHAFCYGCQVVFLCNGTMVHMDRRYSYILTATMVFKACMFMCMYSNNGAHIVTAHVIHFVYYGCAFLSLFFYWWTPELDSGGWLVGIYALAILLTYTAGRYYGLPNYPSSEQIIRLYKLDVTTGEWKLASTPQLLSGDCETEVRPPRSEYSIWSLTLPAFEIFNAHASSSFAWGVLSAVLVNATIVHLMNGMLPDMVSQDTTILYISIAVAVVVAFLNQSVGLYGSAENKLHLRTLARFWPRTTSVFAAALGAAATVVHLAPPPHVYDNTLDDDDDDGQEDSEIAAGSSDIVVWVGYGALLVAVLMTYVTAFIASKAFFRQKQTSRAEF